MLFTERDLLEKTKFISSKAINVIKYQEIFDKYNYHNLFNVINNIDLIVELKKIDKQRIQKHIEKIFLKIEKDFYLFLGKNKMKNLYLYCNNFTEKELYTLIELIIRVKYKSNSDRNLDIMLKRYGLNNSSLETLEDIGLYYGITRERVRQISNDIIIRLSEILLSTRFKISKYLHEKLFKLKSFLDSNDYLITETCLFDFINKEYIDVDKNFIYFLINILNYENVVNLVEYSGEKEKGLWIKRNTNIHHERIKIITSSFNKILKKEDKIDKFKFIGDVKREINNRKEDNELILSLLKVCTDYEIYDSHIERKIEYLPKKEQIFKIIEKSKEPLHIKDICKTLMNYDNSVTQRYVSSILSNDNRFCNISKSGRWFLTEDNHQNITIKDAIKKVLENGKILSIDDIYSEVSKIRYKTKKRSLITNLYNYELFENIKENHFALFDGKNSKSIEKRKKKIEESKFDILNYIKKELTEEITFPKLILKIKSEFDYSEQAIRNFVLRQDNLIKRKHFGRIYIMYSDENKIIEKITLRERIQDDVRSILYSNPNTPYRKKYLYDEISKNFNCNKITFYNYLREMTDIKHWREDIKNYYVMYEYSKDSNSIDILDKNIDGIKDKVTKENLYDVKNYLTVEKIDIGIYKLSIQFEKTIKKFLELCKEKKLYDITNKDLKSLVNMINYIEKEGIVRKGFYLNILREERNNIMHDGITTSKEQLFFKAHYFVPLYFDNILFFERKIEDIT
ncbi:hypothetical protein [Halarcobacter sp.]|uniref:hypothetical protein n=1 Tax=Halarcobacter sp. TaxID=2321133 RepID=UPI002AA672AA|nr:hypothetical protein [Halarcobacter sp.]